MRSKCLLRLNDLVKAETLVSPSNLSLTWSPRGNIVLIHMSLSFCLNRVLKLDNNLNDLTLDMLLSPLCNELEPDTAQTLEI